MIKIIAAVNNKGGVGKTKLSELLAEYISKIMGKRVLAIDFDPQCNFSQRYLKMDIDPASPEGLMPPPHPDYDPTNPEDADWSGYSSISGIFFGEPVVPYPTYIKTLDLAPGHAERLLSAESVRKNEVMQKVHQRLSLFLNGDDVQNSYDVVVIDTAPSKGPLTVSVIRAATDIIIPAVMEAQPIQGVYGMLQLWMQESLNREKHRPLNLVGILPNMFKPTTLHNDMLAGLM
jgi:chromosome partitioning protein